MIILKVTKKQDFTLSLSKKPTFGKTTGYVKFWLKIPKENLKAQKDLALYNSCSH